VVKDKAEPLNVTQLLQESGKLLIDPSNEHIVEKLVYTEDYDTNGMNRECAINASSLQPLFPIHIGSLRNYYK
jgi:hypothetical protein